MPEQKITVIKSAPETQPIPVKPEKRIAESNIRIEPCNESDCEKVAEITYTCFPTSFWDRKEPPSLRPLDDSIRMKRLVQRILPSFSVPHIKWIKAVHVPTNQIMGMACWTSPGGPVHGHFRRSAIELYGWKEKMGWTDAEIDEMWSHVSDEAWNGTCEKDDAARRKIMGDEPHWYLSPLCTLPEYQGRGVGKKLLQWAIEQADATDPPTPLYLESAPTARVVYVHCGFVPQTDHALLRRGPAVVKEEVKEPVLDEKQAVLEEKLDDVTAGVVADRLERNVV